MAFVSVSSLLSIPFPNGTAIIIKPHVPHNETLELAQRLWNSRYRQLDDNFGSASSGMQCCPGRVETTDLKPETHIFDDSALVGTARLLVMPTGEPCRAPSSAS
jgi:hypothetical protein